VNNPTLTSFEEIRAIDKPAGQTDDSYKGGVKEDTECPGEVTGSIPNNKSDLRTFHVYEEAGTGTHPGFLNLGWSRVTVRFWDDTANAWGAPQDLTTPSALCPDGDTSNDGGGTVDLGPCATGTINNLNTIPATESDGIIATGFLAQRTFGEAQIDLRLIFQEDQCNTFGAAMLKSRSSDAFTSQLKDFIAPLPIDLTNCGKVIIHKETNPDTNPTTGPQFTYQHNLDTDPAQVDDPTTVGFNESTHFKLRDEGTKTFENVLFGTYSVQELLGTNLPTGGWEFLRVDCVKDTPETGDNPDANVIPTTKVGAVVTFDIDSDTDVLECTYTNQLRVTTVSTAQSVYPNDTATITSSVANAPAPTGNVTFQLYGPDATPNNATDNCDGTVQTLRYTQVHTLVGADNGVASTTNGDGNPPEFPINAANEGTYWWKVSYAGDANNPAVSSCVESTDVDITNGASVSSS
jgi:hypothetical protein